MDVVEGVGASVVIGEADAGGGGVAGVFGETTGGSFAVDVGEVVVGGGVGADAAAVGGVAHAEHAVVVEIAVGAGLDAEGVGNVGIHVDFVAVDVFAAADAALAGAEDEVVGDGGILAGGKLFVLLVAIVDGAGGTLLVLMVTVAAAEGVFEAIVVDEAAGEVGAGGRIAVPLQ